MVNRAINKLNLNKKNRFDPIPPARCPNWDCDELNISIGDKQTVCISNITKTDAITVAEELLSKWDFSYFLEFNDIEEYYKFFKN